MAVALTAVSGAALGALASAVEVAGKGGSGKTRALRRVCCFSSSAASPSLCTSRARGGGAGTVVDGRKHRRAYVVVKAAGEGVETEVEPKVGGDVLPSDQWPENFSLLNFEDLSAHYEPALFKAEAQPGTYLADVMSKTIYTVTVEQTLAEVDHFFNDISGLPVVDAEFKVIGVLSRKDRSKASDAGNSKVGEMMSTPAITLSADKTVNDAAVLMLKNKIHRIPIVNSTHHIVGIVTRTDIFTALET